MAERFKVKLISCLRIANSYRMVYPSLDPSEQSTLGSDDHEVLP